MSRNTYDISVLESAQWVWPCECTAHARDLHHPWICDWPPGQAWPWMTPQHSNAQWMSACHLQCSIPHTFELGHQALKMNVTMKLLFLHATVPAVFCTKWQCLQWCVHSVYSHLCHVNNHLYVSTVICTTSTVMCTMSTVKMPSALYTVYLSI